MTRKVKTMIYIVGTLWLVVFAQMAMTKIYVKNHDVTQAFARNQLVLETGNQDMQQICQRGGMVQGTISGKLSPEKRDALVKDMFGYEGGNCVYARDNSDYYVAYGFTNGIPLVKQVGGTNINMNIAITYDETEDKTRVYFGVPLIREDF